uniref:Putative ryanodine receptor n=1 Tax=uncultured Thiotrichaceae bacterium TaxID=298394 RepID=A0A6S6SBN5_9GAMM|nr:MAG: putative ryanodine receptor [uncultured Thiotrichaceae bacterium]
MYQPKPLDTTAVQLPEQLEGLLENLAQNTHEVWAEQRLKDGWRYGEDRNDQERLHPCLVPYDELPEEEKEYDRNTAREVLKAILAAGFTIERR